MLPLMLLGAGGHARVLAEILLGQGNTFLGITDIHAPTPDRSNGPWSTLPFLGDDHAVFEHSPDSLFLINGVGSVGPISARQALFLRFTVAGYRFASVCHPTAVISPSAQLGAGHQILATAVVAAGAHLGNNVLVNTRAVIEHECRVDDHCHIATGAVVCGGCHIGTAVHIGAGATINQGIQIGAGAVIASGSAVIEDVPPHTLVAGVPARHKRTLAE
ncbi:MAG: acetyltransferase [Gammaproteobacteria bacterium]|nr:acetyltransferase [Gammaproteobacteria bacterium]